MTSDPITSSDIRRGFLEFFKNKDHKIIEGSSVVPKDDPSLLFINAGMAPLKPYFLGHKKPDNPRMANVQPCIRTKDIADVGDRHHLTMFEMLGSWSIGDYFKTKAVEYAYELLVDVFKFDPARLYATCYAGNPSRNLPPDDESAKAWVSCGIPEERVLMLGEDNFWSAGDTGPCGPCTEVFYDFGDSFGPAYKKGDEFDTTKRYIEIWNAGVFMEFNRKKDGSFEPLPFKSVDTGSGLERMVMAKNGTATVYETDLFAPLMAFAQSAYPNLETKDYRVISDHIRAASFILAGGILPSNEGQGYIPRRLLRKCISSVFRAGGDYDGLIELFRLVDQKLGEDFPELTRAKHQIEGAIRDEVKEFAPIIKAGIKIFDAKLSELPSKTLPGPVAFDLVATHGLPLEVIDELAAAKGFTLDHAGYDKAFTDHQAVSRVLSGAQTVSSEVDEILTKEVAKLPPTEYVGYSDLKVTTRAELLVSASGELSALKSGSEGFLVVAKTPFYAESGGQIADTGTITGPGFEGLVSNCQKKGDVFVHSIKLTKGQLAPDAPITLEVDAETRHGTQNHHSATHLLHSALRQHLGSSVVQKGSLVQSSRLRFDFQWSKAMTTEEIAAVEHTVNQWIWRSIPSSINEMPYDMALEQGAIALFGENYGDQVRVVKFQEASTELCGGCHVKNTADIGMFVILSETSIAKGVRRIEAITGKDALSYVQDQRQTLRQIADALQSKPEAAAEAITKLKQKLKELQKSKSKSPSNPTTQSAFQNLEKGANAHGKFALATTELARDELTGVANSFMTKEKLDFAVFLSPSESKNILFVFSNNKALNAKALLNELLDPLGGRGGGKEHFAQGGFASDLSVEAMLAQIKKGL